MRYQVIAKFRDKFTKEIYEVGREIELTDEKRIADLQKRKLISEAIEEPIAEPKHVGRGMYELPDGTRIKGKQAAIEAMNGSDEDD